MNIMHTKYIYPWYTAISELINKVAAIGLLLTISSCTMPTIDPKQSSFGEALRSMVEAQTMHKTKPVKPKEDKLQRGLNGKLGEKIFEKYHQSQGEKMTVESTKGSKSINN